MNSEEYIPSVTVKNVTKMKFSEMLTLLKPYVLEFIPEGILGDQDAYGEIERLLGRFANIYAYLMYLYSHVANETNRAKHADDTVRKDMLTQKKNALFELARAVRYKHEACSRMLTAALGQEKHNAVFETADIKSRVRKVGGWEAVS